MRNSQIRDFVISYLINHIHKEDIVVDATVGNGHDTLLLCELANHVYGFDIQKEAINATKQLLSSQGISNYTLIHNSFETILDYVQSFKAVIFNLGYLPNGNKSITTTKKTTLHTLNLLIDQLKTGCFIIITCYPGHEAGLIESEAILQFINTLPDCFIPLRYHVTNKTNAPFCVVIEKN